MKKAKYNAFTIVELIITIAIIGVIVAIATPIYLTFVNNATENLYPNAERAYVLYYTETRSKGLTFLSREDVVLVPYADKASKDKIDIVSIHEQRSSKALIFDSNKATTWINANLYDVGHNPTYMGVYENYQLWQKGENYIPLDADGNLNENGNYITFGSYAQTVKDSKVKINKDKTLARSSIIYYLGDDNEWYTQERAITSLLDSYGNAISFNDGSEIIQQQNYYFKLEPMIYRILSNDNNDLLLYPTTVVAGGSVLDTPTLSATDIYQVSEMRSWLNNQFYNSFIKDEKEMIITNSIETENGNILDDKIFIPDTVFLSETEYGFKQAEEFDLLRAPFTSDYLLMTLEADGMEVVEDKIYYGVDHWIMNGSSINVYTTGHPVTSEHITIKDLTSKSAYIPVMKINIA